MLVEPFSVSLFSFLSLRSHLAILPHPSSLTRVGGKGGGGGEGTDEEHFTKQVRYTGFHTHTALHNV